jgi:hypothetical protein
MQGEGFTHIQNEKFYNTKYILRFQTAQNIYGLLNLTHPK